MGGRRVRGLSLLECLVSLAILSLVLLMSFTVLNRYKLYLQRIDERCLATRAADGELETLLASPSGALYPWPRSEAESRPPELSRLKTPRLTHEIFSTGVPELLRVRVELSWARDEGRAVVAEALRFTGSRPRAREDGE